MKKSLVKEEIKSGIEALVEALLFPILNFLTKPWLASSSCFPLGLAERLMQKFYQVQDLRVIAIEIWLWFF